MSTTPVTQKQLGFVVGIFSLVLVTVSLTIGVSAIVRSYLSTEIVMPADDDKTVDIQISEDNPYFKLGRMHGGSIMHIRSDANPFVNENRRVAWLAGWVVGRSGRDVDVRYAEKIAEASKLHEAAKLVLLRGVEKAIRQEEEFMEAIRNQTNPDNIAPVGPIGDF